MITVTSNVKFRLVFLCEKVGVENYTPM